MQRLLTTTYKQFVMICDKNKLQVIGRSFHSHSNNPVAEIANEFAETTNEFAEITNAIAEIA
ncbi:MAG: hypothetical protein V7K66_30120, partial [Nostoc sp.]